jgi:hypothetical protein
LTLTAATVNFIAPSYIIGIAVGLLALMLGLVRSARIVVPIVAITVFFTAELAINRLGSVNTTAIDVLGTHPKIFTYLASLEALADGHLLGLGVGQFTSTPQTWLDPGLAAGAAHGVPSLPLFTPSDAYVDRISPYTEVGSKSAWTFSSSLNQPVAGWAALLGEWGVGVLIVIVALWRRLAGTLRAQSLRAAAIFVVVVNLVDAWFDNPWFGVALILLYGVAARLGERQRQRAESPAGFRAERGRSFRCCDACSLPLWKQQRRTRP